MMRRENLRKELVPEIRMAQSIEKMKTILNRHLGGQYEHPIEVDSIDVPSDQAGLFYHLEYNLSIGVNQVAFIGEIYPQYIPKNRHFLTQHIYQQFKSHSKGKFAIPKPVCIIPELKMSLREKVNGSGIVNQLIKQQDVQLAKNISQLVNTLHQSEVMIASFQGYEYVRKTLRQLKTTAHVYHTTLYQRIHKIVDKTYKLIAGLPNHNIALIHSHLMLQQISCDQNILYLYGTERCTMGDPCMDIGSLIADIQILSFCEFGNWSASTKIEQSMLEEYLRLNPEYTCESLYCYNLFGLIRQAGEAIINNNITLAGAIVGQCETMLS